MLKKVITYTDFNEVQRTETFYFNLTKTELYKWENSVNGGLTNLLNRILEEQDQQKLIEYFQTLIEYSYGVKSDDGKHLRKSPELLADFMSTNAYDVLYIELVSDADKAMAFLKGILPPDLAGALNDKNAAQVISEYTSQQALAEA